MTKYPNPSTITPLDVIKQEHLYDHFTYHAYRNTSTSSSSLSQCSSSSYSPSSILNGICSLIVMKELDAKECASVSSDYYYIHCAAVIETFNSTFLQFSTLKSPAPSLYFGDCSRLMHQVDDNSTVNCLELTNRIRYTSPIIYLSSIRNGWLTVSKELAVSVYQLREEILLEIPEDSYKQSSRPRISTLTFQWPLPPEKYSFFTTSQCNNQLVCATPIGLVHVFDFGPLIMTPNRARKSKFSKKPVQSIVCTASTITCVSASRFHGHGFIACGFANGHVCVQDTRIASKICPNGMRIMHDGSVTAIDFSPLTNELLLSGGESGKIILWSVHPITLVSTSLYTFNYHESPIRSLSFAPFACGNTSSIFASCDDDIIIIWNIQKVGQEDYIEMWNGAPPEILFIHNTHKDNSDIIESFTWAGSGLPWGLVSVGTDGVIQLWSPSSIFYTDLAETNIAAKILIALYEQRSYYAPERDLNKCIKGSISSSTSAHRLAGTTNVSKTLETNREDLGDDKTGPDDAHENFSRRKRKIHPKPNLSTLANISDALTHSMIPRLITSRPYKEHKRDKLSTEAQRFLTIEAKPPKLKHPEKNPSTATTLPCPFKDCDFAARFKSKHKLINHWQSKHLSDPLPPDLMEYQANLMAHSATPGEFVTTSVVSLDSLPPAPAEMSR